MTGLPTIVHNGHMNAARALEQRSKRAVHADRRTRRNRTRAAQRQRAIKEQS